MKILKILAILFAAVLCTVAFTSCGDDDDKNGNNCCFSVSIDSYTISAAGAGANAETELLAYTKQVQQAYNDALGMTDGTVYVSGDYSTLSAQMKTKFEGVTLPATFSSKGLSYSFKVVLTGVDLKKSTNYSTIAEKTFSDSGK